MKYYKPHPLSPPSNSKIKPPYIPPPPKHTMNKPTLWLPTIKRYDDGFTIPSMIEAQHAGYVSYPDYLEIKARSDAMEAENARLKAQVKRLTKAGDAMAGVLGLPINAVQEFELNQAWHKAKGVQS